MKKIILLGIIATALVMTFSPVLASDIGFREGLSQGDFNSLTKEAGAAIGYKNMAPAAPLGTTGFDAGLEISALSIDDGSLKWKNAFGGDAPSYLIIPKIRVRKGLPFGIDIGAMYSYVPDTNIKLYGAEISKAILEGTLATPAVSVRATYTTLSGVNDLGLQTFGIDTSVSKGFILVTPYAGTGVIWVNGEATGNLKKTLSPDLKSETVFMPRIFGGVKFTPLPLLGITAEIEYAVHPMYSLKAGVSF